MYDSGLVFDWKLPRGNARSRCPWEEEDTPTSRSKVQSRFA